MFSDAETTFVQEYVKLYNEKGYEYYVVQTVSEYNVDTDVRFYFSREPIEFSGQRVFRITDGIRIDFDNSNSYQITTPRLSQSSASGSVTVAVQENIYTNGVQEYTSAPYNPGILPDTYDFKVYFLVFAVVTVLILFFKCISDWLRGR